MKTGLNPEAGNARPQVLVVNLVKPFPSLWKSNQCLQPVSYLNNQSSMATSQLSGNTGSLELSNKSH